MCTCNHHSLLQGEATQQGLNIFSSSDRRHRAGGPTPPRSRARNRVPDVVSPLPNEARLVRSSERLAARGSAARQLSVSPIRPLSQQRRQENNADDDDNFEVVGTLRASGQAERDRTTRRDVLQSHVSVAKQDED